jgi:hypothetical protein
MPRNSIKTRLNTVAIEVLEIVTIARTASLPQMSPHFPPPFQTSQLTGQCFPAGGSRIPNGPRLVTERPRYESILLRKTEMVFLWFYIISDLVSVLIL